MSWAATGFVKKLRIAPNGEPITKGEKLLLFVLADYHNEERGDAWASLSHLAAESMHTRPGVVKALRGLEEKGVLVIVRSPDAVSKKIINRYRFVGLDSPAVPRAPVDNCPAEGAREAGASKPSLLALVNPVDQSSKPSLLALVNPVNHIFPKNLSSDLSKDTDAGVTPGDDVTNLTKAAEGILEFLNGKTGRRFLARHPNREPTESLKKILGLLKRGYSEQQIKQVIGNRLVKWEAEPKMREYLRPKTLFSAENFVQYLGQVGAAQHAMS